MISSTDTFGSNKIEDYYYYYEIEWYTHTFQGHYHHFQNKLSYFSAIQNQRLLLTFACRDLQGHHGDINQSRLVWKEEQKSYDVFFNKGGF